MRLDMGLRSTSARGRSTVALLLAGAAIPIIALTWADATTWNDNLNWSDAA